MSKTSLPSKDLGDFQTPLPLVEAVLQRLTAEGRTWSRAFEPTCGQGNFIQGLLQLPIPPREIQGIELQEAYIQSAQQKINLSNLQHVSQVTLRQESIFDVNLRHDLLWKESGNLLIVGNPPWITNSELGMLGSLNLPGKTNIKRHKGLEAMTGSSNFDIAEYIWLKLLQELAIEQPTIAMLCKTSVARNVLQLAAQIGIPIHRAYIRRIDSQKWFNAAVDACLFYVEVGADEVCDSVPVYSNLATEKIETTIGIKSKHLIANMITYRNVAFVDGHCSLTWRQGLKHDAASVMELSDEGNGQLRNKKGQIVQIEPQYIFPLLKSSDIFNGRTDMPRKAIIVTQRQLNDDTNALEQTAPLLWKYLASHREAFQQRKSSIYAGKSPFAIFGIGNYSFSLYKVAISGLYKIPRFVAIGPIHSRPVMLDDTGYFLPCYSAQQAALLSALLNYPLCLEFLASIMFTDAKRPITKKLLDRVDLSALLLHVNHDDLIARADATLANMTSDPPHNPVWPDKLDIFIQESAQVDNNVQLKFLL